MYLIVVLCNVILSSAVDICTRDSKSAPTINKKPGESLRIVCPLYCKENHVFDHYNKQKQQYDKIQEEPSYSATIHITDYTNAGIYRCWCTESETPLYCYLRIKGT